MRRTRWGGVLLALALALLAAPARAEIPANNLPAPEDATTVVDLPTTLPDGFPDLGLPGQVPIDFGPITRIQEWFDPERLDEFRELLELAEVFQRVRDLGPDASLGEFLGAFVGIDADYDRFYQTFTKAQRFLAAYRFVQHWLRPDDLFDEPEIYSPEGARPQPRDAALAAGLQAAPWSLGLAAPVAVAGPGAAADPLAARWQALARQASQDDAFRGPRHSLEDASPDRKTRFEKRLDNIDTHPWQVLSLFPYVEFSAVDEGRTFLYANYNLPVQQSQESARGLRKAWMIFEERYYQRIKATVNNPIPYLAHCKAGLTAGEPDPPLPDVELTTENVTPFPVELSRFWSRIEDTLEPQTPSNHLHMERWQYLADATTIPSFVPGRYFCDDLPPNGRWWPYWLPGIRVRFGPFSYETPDFPEPSWVDADDLRDDVNDAVVHAHTDYLPEYLEQAVLEMIPTPDHPLLFPTPWQLPLQSQSRWRGVNEGRLYYPVADYTDLDITPLLDLSDAAQQIYDDTFTGLVAPLYYFKPVLFASGDPYLKKAAQIPRIIEAIEPGALSREVNGAWPLEELKRFLPPTNPIFYEVFGYQTVYSTTFQPVATFLPDPGDYALDVFYTALRQPLLLYVSFDIDLSTGTVVPIPGAKPVYHFVPELSYLALGMPFLGVRSRHDWYTVPEGYPVPGRPVDTPLIDYWGMPYLSDSLPAKEAP